MTNDERIYQRATSLGIPPILATLIVAQARHETGGYTSNVFKSCLNAFGYKFVGQALSTGACALSPEMNYYAAYASLEDSVTEIVQWIRRRQAEGKFPADLNSITTPDQYAQLLKNSGYYGASVSEYLNGLVYWLQTIGNLAAPAAGIATLLVLTALMLLVFRKK